MDFNSDGTIDLSDVKRRYNAKLHPDVQAGKRTEDEVLCEFLETFEAHFILRHGYASKDRRVSLDEWLEYYNKVSCNIDSDEFFALMMTSAYKL